MYLESNQNTAAFTKTLLHTPKTLLHTPEHCCMHQNTTVCTKILLHQNTAPEPCCFTKMMHKMLHQNLCCTRMPLHQNAAEPEHCLPCQICLSCTAAHARKLLHAPEHCYMHQSTVTLERCYYWPSNVTGPVPLSGLSSSSSLRRSPACTCSYPTHGQTWWRTWFDTMRNNTRGINRYEFPH